MSKFQNHFYIYMYIKKKEEIAHNVKLNVYNEHMN
jgi:hypothetical protein